MNDDAEIKKGNDDGYYPNTLKSLQEELLRHSKDGRSDKLFRVAIAIDQFGSFVRYISHDPILNPTSRPHGTDESMVNDAGHMIVQIMTLAALSGIDLQEAVHSALKNLREKDFVARKAGDPNCIKGIVASFPDRMKAISLLGTGTMIRSSPEKLRAKVRVFKDNNIKYDRGSESVILVAPHPESDARLSKFTGIITDHGGANCHAAIIARERNIPCIVGTGNASWMLKTGDVVDMDMATGEVTLVGSDGWC